MLAKDVEPIIDLEELDEVEDAIRFCTCSSKRSIFYCRSCDARGCIKKDDGWVGGVVTEAENYMKAI